MQTKFYVDGREIISRNITEYYICSECECWTKDALKRADGGYFCRDPKWCEQVKLDRAEIHREFEALSGRSWVDECQKLVDREKQSKKKAAESRIRWSVAEVCKGTCAFCSKEFKKKSKRGKSKYCSDKCRRKFHNDKLTAARKGNEAHNASRRKKRAS